MVSESGDNLIEDIKDSQSCRLPVADRIRQLTSRRVEMRREVRIAMQQWAYIRFLH